MQFSFERKCESAYHVSLFKGKRTSYHCPSTEIPSNYSGHQFNYYHGLTYVIMNQTVNSERYVQILSTKVAPFIWWNEIYHRMGHHLTPCSLLARIRLNEYLHGHWIDWETWISRVAAQISRPDYL